MAGRHKIEIDYELLERLCEIQCTDAEIASVLGISVDTITNRKKDDEQFSDILKKGRESGRMCLRRKMYENATIKGNTVMQIWLSKQYLSMSDKHENVVSMNGKMSLSYMTDEEIANELSNLVGKAGHPEG